MSHRDWHDSDLPVPGTVTGSGGLSQCHGALGRSSTGPARGPGPSQVPPAPESLTVAGGSPASRARTGALAGSSTSVKSAAAAGGGGLSHRAVLSDSEPRATVRVRCDPGRCRRRSRPTDSDSEAHWQSESAGPSSESEAAHRGPRQLGGVRGSSPGRCSQ